MKSSKVYIFGVFLCVIQSFDLFVFRYKLETPVDGKITVSEKEPNYSNDEKLLAKILQNNETVNSQDSQGFTPLLRAARLGHLDDVRILLRNRANVSLVTRKENNTALHYASANGFFNIVKLLIPNRANITAVIRKFTITFGGHRRFNKE